eukprot:3378557-Prymnesium_polylepis.2
MTSSTTRELSTAPTGLCVLLQDHAATPRVTRCTHTLTPSSRAHRLSLMGDLYASVVGTTVLRLERIPPRPANVPAAEYNDRSVAERGWCIFERYVALELSARIENERAFTKLLSKLPNAKMVDISTWPVRVLDHVDDGGGGDGGDDGASRDERGFCERQVRICGADSK